LELFASADALIGSGDAFRDGVELVIEAVLQSPKFLYRIEVGSGVGDAIGIQLNDHEIASRLSFMLLGSMPDAELRQSADAGMVHTQDQIAATVQRLLGEERVAERVVDFHDRWMQLDAIQSATKDAQLFETFDDALVSSMRSEASRFTHEVTLVEGAGIRRLLTADFGFVDESLNRVYELDGNFGSELSRVDYAADSPRSGILTQAAFLSGHSSSNSTTSPILRGRFVLERLLCFSVPEPPPNAASEEPPAPATPPVTTREMFAWRTSPAECSTCHAIINPTGFAFEGFDAIGRFRTMESGAPADASGAAVFPEAFEFQDAKEFVAALSTFQEARACYARNWLRYAYARPDTARDLRTLATLAQGFQSDDFGAYDVLSALTQSAAFVHIAE
jgi:hypothetical protein